MTKLFQHLILTRFNVDLYGSKTKARLEPNAWMEHRLRLFEAFTLPSIAAQSCQDFAWRIMMDSRTPDAHVQTMERLCRTNMKLIFPVRGANAWLSGVEPGAYDLLTTRIDNDDAFHRDAVAALHETYRQNRKKLARPWVMVFPFGMIFDLGARRGWLMEYWYNNCPTLVEDGQAPQTIWQWRHNQIPADVPRCPIKDIPYWLQVIHEQNLRNAIESPNALRKIHKEVPMQPKHLAPFGVDPERLPAA
ncbi:MAG: hypothetical protein GXY19_03820 [Phycisphaerae bacterium]|nr:hypothetical protein [Phycisphaerae bacterium]